MDSLPKPKPSLQGAGTKPLKKTPVQVEILKTPKRSRLTPSGSERNKSSDEFRRRKDWTATTEATLTPTAKTKNKGEVFSDIGAARREIHPKIQPKPVQA